MTKAQDEIKEWREKNKSHHVQMSAALMFARQALDRRTPGPCDIDQIIRDAFDFGVAFDAERKRRKV